MKPIGGYFELELNSRGHYHENALKLNSARNCLECLLMDRHYTVVYIPYYTCEVVLEPIIKLGIEYRYYQLNHELEPVSLPKLHTGEAFLYTNYFGLKQECVNRLATVYGQGLLVDNSQAFFAKPVEHVDTFYSARKFFGVPDGAYLYAEGISVDQYEYSHSASRMSHLLIRLEDGAEAGYEEFKKNDANLSNLSICRMSLLTSRILGSIDYEAIAARRRSNYLLLNDALGMINGAHFSIGSEDVPMVYPFIDSRQRISREKLIENKIFVAKYWPNVIDHPNFETESFLANFLLPLPVDQRYGKDDMNRIISTINEA